MSEKDLKKPIAALSGVGSRVEEKLDRLGIKTIGDLVWHIPHRYEDFSNRKKICELREGEKATVTAQILALESRRAWRRRNMMLTEAVVEDETGPIRVVWFNQPFLEDTLKPDLWVSLSGKVSLDKKGLVLSNPIFELIGSHPDTKDEGELTHTGGLVPIYPETRGLTSRWLRYKIKALLGQLEPVTDFMPRFIMDTCNLLPLDEALRKVHFPASQTDYEGARRRLAFNDLFLIQLFAAQEKQKVQKEKAPQVPTNVDLIKSFVSSLPFTLTDSQRVAAWQILKDMERPHPMNRLLEGDVGSGKTVVAAIAARAATSAGFQVAYLAPTEILARQHFDSLSHYFKKDMALLTASTKSGEVTKKIAQGDVAFVIGTHALIQKDVLFNNLGLLIVDEQHRFGVNQRAHLTRGQKLVPHLLSMTATPIPRTLALTLYGDLDLSLLKEMPKGRKKIQTRVVPPAKREDAYEFIRDQVEKGRQVFVICPLIEESEALEVRSVTEEHKKLSEKVFPSLSVAMLHGKLKPAEKDEIMRQFKNGTVDILVSTAVVEVGIDVPNATVMMIEGAERFGLAQLHQFRGRVGRGEHQSYCLLFTDSKSKATKERLTALVQSEDGFALAEKDLALRGPGQFFGTQQSGLPDLAMEGLKDVQMIEQAQEAVQTFLEQSSLTEHPQLAAKMKEFTQRIHWE